MIVMPSQDVFLHNTPEYMGRAGWQYTSCYILLLLVCVMGMSVLFMFGIHDV